MSGQHPHRHPQSQQPNTAMGVDKDHPALQIPGQTGKEVQRVPSNYSASYNASGGAVMWSNQNQQRGTTGQGCHSRVQVQTHRTDVHGQAHMTARRQVSVTVCTSSHDYNVKGLLNHLKDLQRKHPDLIKNVSYYSLPYNGIDEHKFTKERPVDVMILCHSITNRRFAITDVPDACYDKFLPHCQKSLGKEKIAVIAHDFEKMSDQEFSDRMTNFKLKQPTTFNNAGLVMMCGKLIDGERLTEPSTAQMLNFLKKASTYPEEIKTGMFSSIRSLPDRFKSGVPGQANAPYPAQDAHIVTPAHYSVQHSVQHPAQIPVQRHDQHTSRYLTQYPVQHPVKHPVQDSAHFAQQSPPSRPISVSVYTSAYEHNVERLMSWLRELKADHPHLIADVCFRNLPYNDIDSFKFSSKDPPDVIVLCHSVHNRGFSITDVTNSLYDRYLKYCSKEIGKKKLAVIVHDITEWNPAVVPSKMDTFQKTQPSTFKFADTVMVCGNLEKPDKLEMSETDMTRLFSFFESAGLEPRKKQSMLGKVKSQIF